MKRKLLLMVVVLILMSSFALPALAADKDEVTITGTIRESDGTPAEKGKYVLSITTDKLVCISGTDGFITLVPQFMDDTHVLTVKKDNVEVASANINLSHGDEYSLVATESGADIVVPVGMKEIQFDIIVDDDILIIEEDSETTIAASSKKSSSSALIYVVIAAVVVIIIITIILISKKKTKA